MLVALALLLLPLTSGERRLRLRHDLLSWMRDSATVVTLEVERAGELRMFLNPDDRKITPLMLFYRAWEPKETRWFVQGLREGDLVVDVGANVGYYTLIASRIVGPEGRVYAFEPDPVSFALLERNVRLNGLSNVVLEPKAVSNVPEPIRLYLAPENKGDHRIYQPSGEDRPFVDVDAVVLDEYFADRRADIDFVKIDTQGAEIVILRGMRKILQQSRGLRMALEIWPGALADFGHEPQELLDILQSAGFRLFGLDGRPESPLRELEVAKLRESVRQAGQMGQANLLAVRRPGDLGALRAAGAQLQAPLR